MPMSQCSPTPSVYTTSCILVFAGATPLEIGKSIQLNGTLTYTSVHACSRTNTHPTGYTATDAADVHSESAGQDGVVAATTRAPLGDEEMGVAESSDAVDQEDLKDCSSSYNITETDASPQNSTSTHCEDTVASSAREEDYPTTALADNATKSPPSRDARSGDNVTCFDGDSSVSSTLPVDASDSVSDHGADATTALTAATPPAANGHAPSHSSHLSPVAEDTGAVDDTCAVDDGEHERTPRAREQQNSNGYAGVATADAHTIVRTASEPNPPRQTEDAHVTTASTTGSAPGSPLAVRLRARTSSAPQQVSSGEDVSVSSCYAHSVGMQQRTCTADRQTKGLCANAACLYYNNLHNCS